MQANEITQLEMDYLTPFKDVLKSINIFIIYGVVLFIFIDWKIALIILVLSILSTFIAPNLTSKPLSARRKKYTDNLGVYTAKIKDFLEGFKLIQSITRNKIISEQEKTLNDTSK